MNHQQNLTAYLYALINELVQSGIENVVISPGSRSTPIAMLMAEQEQLNLFVHVDERSAAFYALGMAKASKKPTVLVCTSGTAAANYFPAIIEAKISRIPLIVLTADRPHELRDVGAPQAINQIELYGRQVKWFVEMSPPDGTEGMIRYAKTVGARAVATTLLEPKGPVHINLPIREPLIPDLENIEAYRKNEKNNSSIHIEQGSLAIPEEYFQSLAKKMQSLTNGIIICGELYKEKFPESLFKLAKKLNFPILADPLSQLRVNMDGEEFIIDAYDTFLRNEKAKQKLKPNIIIRFGSMPISKALTLFLKEHKDVEQLVVDGGGGFRDPNQLTSEMIYCEEVLFCERLISYLPSCSINHELVSWQNINFLTKKALRKIEEVADMSEGKLFSKLGNLLPEDAVLFVGNSMPIRDLDTFFHLQQGKITIFANRGANGIDGTVSTALGVGAVTKSRPLYLIVGDLTFFHDLNGLIAAKQFQIPITVLLINNNGGGIFSFLPQANHKKYFELLFGTPLDLDFKHIVAMYNGQYLSIENWHQLEQELSKKKEGNSIRIVEIKTNRDENLAEHRNLLNNVSQEIDLYFKDGI
ncbi:2-succinyl-5-enolpyruvyl-6-hydroxy-3-cyclohexene-1-carboxylic-acid synthase [Niallia nealsonii]|uniref:2-succinyl-5-enolpyruvyl-6-hydroxy-3-cyclohexene-1-carboxylate synthase n=1 Tax=Niallia nealsonii TaxID=115979 RepID=A0A2N0YY94_9BACI|nr:2-succinyl-5-enolpyruvyl-6-hydroxy-3-cyclohexene-1-carboxylic-acid synthase [Niallia nealsonii]PKG22231.1 2-succinyl-5-enolpyruvyl-6-hydroxy-3-cyclohexene-1-carboxylic-acid synthase [Niallia nealsonii]